MRGGRKDRFGTTRDWLPSWGAAVLRPSFGRIGSASPDGPKLVISTGGTALSPSRRQKSLFARTLLVEVLDMEERFLATLEMTGREEASRKAVGGEESGHF